MNTTAWFDLKVKPVRVGVYQIQNVYNDEPHYSYWNGLYWCLTCDDPKSASTYASVKSYTFNSSKPFYVAWRGLDKQP